MNNTMNSQTPLPVDVDFRGVLIEVILVLQQVLNEESQMTRETRIELLEVLSYLFQYLSSSPENPASDSYFMSFNHFHSDGKDSVTFPS